jgi:hypothetical protein
MVLITETQGPNLVLLELYLQKLELLTESERSTIMRIIRKIYFPYNTVDKDMQKEGEK